MDVENGDSTADLPADAEAVPTRKAVQSIVPTEIEPIFPKNLPLLANTSSNAASRLVPVPDPASVSKSTGTLAANTSAPTSPVAAAPATPPAPRGPGHRVQFKLDFNMLVQKGISRKNTRTYMVSP
jgi:hypothetical protein